LAWCRWRRPRCAEETPWRHGLSLFGDVKYPAGFKHFDYVNPQAPKAASCGMIAVGTFDNFNMAVSGVRGQLGGRLNLLYETLMAELDRRGVHAKYGLLGRSGEASAGFFERDLSAARRCALARRQAGHHRGRDLLARAFKKHHPQYASYYRHVTKAEKTGERDVTFTFDGPGNRELPLIVGQLYVLPKHWWEGTDANGNKRDIGQTRWSRRSAAGPIASRASPRAHRGLRAGEGLIGARTSTSISAAITSMKSVTSISATPRSRWKRSRATASIWRTENSALNWATRYDFRRAPRSA
jgi:microcin C transport system substrate-binding protein